MIGNSYSYSSEGSNTKFTFESVGVRGITKKVVFFVEYPNSGGYFNLALCDIINGVIRDDITTNNGDMEKVLNTVATIVHDFIRYNSKVIGIVSIGLDATRNRLYRMQINKNLFLISSYYDVFGLFREKEAITDFEPFTSDKMYDGFLIMKNSSKLEL